MGTTGQPMLPATKAKRVRSAVKRLRSIKGVLTHRCMAGSYTGHITISTEPEQLANSWKTAVLR
jgi:hypothetical protein